MPRVNADRTVGIEPAVAQRVAYERGQRGWSPAGLALRMTKAGCSLRQSAIWKIENAGRRITLDEAVAFSRVFELTLNDFLRPVEVLRSESLERDLRNLAILRTVLDDATAELDATFARVSDQLSDPTAQDTIRAWVEAHPDNPTVQLDDRPGVRGLTLTSGTLGGLPESVVNWMREGTDDGVHLPWSPSSRADTHDATDLRNDGGVHA